MKLNQDTRNAISRALNSNDATIAYISSDLKSSAQTKIISEHTASIKKEVSKNKNLVLIAISASSINDFLS
jgi:hypothetical protein